MAATTEGAIFRELLTDVETLVTATLHADRVYLRAVPGFEDRAKDRRELQPPFIVDLCKSVSP